MADIKQARASITANLKNSGIKPMSAAGKKALFFYWLGYAASFDTPPPGVLTPLMSGRYEDLYDKVPT